VPELRGALRRLYERGGPDAILGVVLVALGAIAIVVAAVIAALH
jgi:hypothetical protein